MYFETVPNRVKRINHCYFLLQKNENVSSFISFLLLFPLIFFFFFFFFAVLGFQFRGYTLSHSTTPALFCDEIFFKIGSHELFAWAGFEPQSS
jgi:hypothetical protein